MMGNHPRVTRPEPTPKPPKPGLSHKDDLTFQIMLALLKNGSRNYGYDAVVHEAIAIVESFLKVTKNE